MLEKTAPQLAQKHDFVGSSFALVALAMGYARLGEFDKAEACRGPGPQAGSSKATSSRNWTR